MKMISKKNMLDEHQEQVLLHVEKQTCWLGFFGLCLAIIVQLTFLGGTGTEVVGETVVMLGMGIYMLIGCVRNGIWDRHIRVSWKTNVIASLIAGIVVFGTQVFQLIHSYEVDSKMAMKWGLFGFGLTFVLTFCLMTLLSYLTKKKQEKLEKEEE